MIPLLNNGFRFLEYVNQSLNLFIRLRRQAMSPLLGQIVRGDIQKAFHGMTSRGHDLWPQGVFEAKRAIRSVSNLTSLDTPSSEAGWWAPSYKTFDEFWKLLQEKGGWWDPMYDFREWDRIFQTPSRKFQFYVQGLTQTQPF